jgi:NEDD4-binding protein 2
MEKTLIIMRGLPWTGKSYTANEVKGETGVVYSTDEFFYKVVKPEKPEEYSFSPRFLGQAHKWNLVRAQNAIEQGVTPIIIDNTNTTPSEPKKYVNYAVPQGYEVRILEPTSDRWQEIRTLLSDKKKNKKALKEWAKKLEAGSKETHSVPFFAIEKMMWRWVCDMTVEMIQNAPDLQ